MCVAVPGKIEELDELLAVVDVGGGATVRVRMDLVPEAGEGDWVLVHAGFAINLVDEESALETRQLLAEADMLMQQEGDQEEP